MTANQIAYWKLEEEKRANRAREEETHRANVVSEGYKKYDTLSKLQDSATKQYEAATHRQRVDDQRKIEGINTALKGVEIVANTLTKTESMGKGISSLVAALA